jgi:hypothetical protein
LANHRQWFHLWVDFFATQYEADNIKDSWFNPKTEKLKVGGKKVPARFYYNVLTTVEGSVPCSMSEPAEKFPQLACLTTSSGPFEAGTDTHMVIITPSKRKKPGIRYPMHIQAIKRKQKDDVMADWAEDRVHVLEYVTKTGDTNANPSHEGGKPNDHRDMVGKSMIQYDPQHVAA